MAFPQIEATQSDTNSSNDTSHTVTMPSNIVAGDLLIVMIAMRPDDSGVSWPGGANDGFTELAEVSNDPGNCTVTSAYRWANGSEPSTITVTSTDSVRSAAYAWRISGAENPATQIPEVTTANGDSTTATVTSNSPTGGAKDYLWLLGCGVEWVHTISTFSTNYTETLIDSTQVSLEVADREANTATESPSDMTVSSTAGWVTHLIAIHPAAAGTTIPIFSHHYTKNIG